MMKLLGIVAALFLCLHRCADGGMGVWVDDGHGRTVKEEIPPREAAVLTRHMLDLLGIPDPPKRHRHHHRKSKGSAPTWLKSVYDALDERGHATGSHLDDVYKATVRAADTIITFVNKMSSDGVFEGKPHHKGNRKLYFNVADVSLDHSLLSAELRLHKQRVPVDLGPLMLHVHMIGEDKSNDKEIARVNLVEEGWMSVNVTDAAISWIIFPETNLGLRLAITHLDKKHELHLNDVGVTGAHGEDHLRPFLVGFFALPNHLHNRKIRSLPYSRSVNKRNPYLIPDDSSSQRGLCQKRHLHVSFRDLGWDEWVIAPDGYFANFCEGRCEFPLQADMNATNHAIVQTLVKVKNAVKDGQTLPPSACCAPKDLTTISVLYYDYNNNVVLKKYPQMIVKSCGCL